MLSSKEQLEEAERLAADGLPEAVLESYTLFLKDPKLKSDDFFKVNLRVGSILTSLKRFDEARDTYMAAIARAKQLKKYERVAEFWHQSALNEIQAGRVDEAIQDLRNELDMMSSRYENYFALLSANYHQQGTLFFDQGDLSESRLYFELALAFAETEGDLLSEANAHDGLARTYLAGEDKARALLHFNQALTQYNEGKDNAAAQRVRRQIKKLKDSAKG